MSFAATPHLALMTGGSGLCGQGMASLRFALIP